MISLGSRQRVGVTWYQQRNVHSRGVVPTMTLYLYGLFDTRPWHAMTVCASSDTPFLSFFQWQGRVYLVLRRSQCVTHFVLDTASQVVIAITVAVQASASWCTMLKVNPDRLSHLWQRPLPLCSTLSPERQSPDPNPLVSGPRCTAASAYSRP